MEENKNDIDELVKSIDSSFEEMSLKDIVSAHENYFGTDDIPFDKDKMEEEKADALSDDGKEKAGENNTKRDRTKDEFLTDRKSEKKAGSQIDKVKSFENAKEDKSRNNNAKTELSEEQKQNIREMKVKKAGHIGNWFQTFCYMRIPIIGFIYILVMAFSKKTPDYKKEFAKGYILYKVLVWILAIVLLYCLYKIGLDFVDGMLSFIKD